MLHTLGLGEDIIAQVLCFCDIQTVISVSEVCRNYHTIAFSKTPWLSIVTNLKSRLLLGVAVFEVDELSTLPTVSLVELAKRAVKGPKSWSPSYHGLPTILVYQSIHPPTTQPHITRDNAKLLPGGRYVLENGMHLRCWKVPEARLVWQHHAQDNESILDFGADIIEEGRAVVIVICGRNRARFENNAYVVRLDLDAETDHVLLVVPLPYTKIDNVFSPPKIFGDLAVVNLKFLDKIVVISLKTKSHMFLALPGNSNTADVECVPGHIITIQHASSGHKVVITAWSVASFEGHWVCSGSEAPSDPVRVPPPWQIHRRSRFLTSALSLLSPVTRFMRLHQPTRGSPSSFFSDVVEIPHSYLARGCHLSAHISPLRDNSFRIWVHIDIKSRHLERAKKSCILLRYRLTLDPTSLQASIYKVDHQDLNKRHLDLGWYRGISYAGHMNTFYSEVYDKANIISCTELDLYESGDQKEKGLIQLPGYVISTISSHGGALVFPKDQQVIVQYYK